MDAATARIEADSAILDLPPRLALFGLTRLPAGYLRVLQALAAQRDVHLLLLHPSPALWKALLDAPPVARRRDDPTATAPANRLLASWGRDAREMQLVLHGAAHADHHHPVEHADRTLLQRLQADVRADRAAPGAPLPGHGDERLALVPDDRTVQVHACHGRARQVEVLRDAVLHLLADDPTLEPRDVIVMCPDIETFAPLVQATFGSAAIDEDGLPDDVRPADLRVRLADRALRQTNPILGVVAALVELAGERVTASQVLDLVDREPVRRRFGLDDDAVARIERWVADGGVRWGLDAEHRAPFKLDGLPAGTWRAGLDRVLLGVTMTEQPAELFAGVLPLDDVGSGDIELAGRLAELVDRLAGALDALATAQTIASYADALAQAVDALTDTGPREAWQRAELDRLLADVTDEARDAGATELALGELRALLAERLRGRPTRANFRTGHLTVCTLTPMRSVPHRVVCLLGMDDGVFPRSAPRDGDDLTLADPHVGERDPRSEDRQLLLDALLAATDHLVVTFTGNDERTNKPRPPAVPMGELLDAVDASARTPDGTSARERVLIRHPLQPFDPRNFAPGALVADRPWSFDPVALGGARALDAPRETPAPFLSAPLSARDEPVVALADLERFVAHPVRAFLRQRLGFSLGDRGDDVDDALAVELDGLERWAVGERLVAGVLAGASLEACVAAELARGTLPPGRLALGVLGDLRPEVEAIVARARAGLGPGARPGSVDVHVELATGRTLTGSVAGVCGDVLRTVTFSRLNARHRLEAWVRLLALSAARPERPFTALTVARGATARIGPVGAEAAREHFTALVGLRDRGLREPLPLVRDASAAWAADRGDPARAARQEWDSRFDFRGEDVDPEHVLVFGGALDLESPPRSDESGPGWATDETTRFGRLAHRLWDGLLAVEERE